MKSSVSQLDAVGLATAGYTLWMLTDVSLKFVGASTLPFYEIIAFVGLSIVGWLLLRGALLRNVKTLWPLRPARQIFRSFLDLGNNVGVVIALRHMPLALFYTLVFCAPMVITLLAAIALHEPLEWRRGAAIVVGFAGVVLAVNPFSATHAGDWTGYLACAMCVMCFSVNMVWSRAMMQTERPESLTFFSSSVMALVGLAAMLHRAEPVTRTVGWTLVATGLLCVIGNFCFFTALKHATASTVSQFHYSQLLTGALIAYVIWHERPSAAMLAGAVLIIASGLYTAARSYNAQVDIEATVRAT